MSISRRQLEAFGETLGDSVTRKEGGRIVYGGGGSSAPAQTTQVSDLPDWAKPYAKETLGQASALTDINQNPYQTYGGQRIADFSGLQTQAQNAAANLTGAPQMGAATGMAAEAGQRALGMQYQPTNITNQYQGIAGYNPSQFSNQFQAPGAYQAGQFNVNQVGTQGLQNYQMGPAQQVRTGSFTQPGSAEAYMSPYMQNVVDIQKREASRQSDILRNQQQAQAVGAGAFGGSRQAIVEAERQRNLGQQLGDIQATGSQAAYQQAQQQFNAEQQARLAAQQANQQAGLTTGQANLNAALGVQQLGAQQGLQAQLANQQYGLQAQQLAEQSRQFGAGQGLSAAQLQAQYGLSAQQAQEAANQFAYNQAAQQAAQQAQYGQSAQQLAEQSRQYGAGLGLQGLQTALTGAGQLANIGQQQFAQNQDVINLQNQIGQQQTAQQQNILSQQYQDFLNQQKYPYQQLEFMSNILRGTPMGTVQTLYGGQPSLGSQVLGAGTSLAGAYMLGGGQFADGGEVKSAGLADLALSKI